MKKYSTNTVTILALVIVVSACAQVHIKDRGYGKLVDYDCNPVPNTTIKVKNIIRGTYFSSGDIDLSKEKTDEQGRFEFDIGGNVSFINFSLDIEGEWWKSYLRKVSQIATVSWDPIDLEEIFNTRKQAPLLLYMSDSGDAAPYEFNRKHQVSVTSVVFNKSYKTTGISSDNVGHLRFGKKDGKNVIKISAYGDGDVSTVSRISSRGFEVANTSRMHVIENIKEDSMHVFYIRTGSKKHAAIVSMRLFYDPLADRVTIKSYSQILQSTTITDEHYVHADLEECGGHMDRGVLGYYSRLTDKERKGINAVRKTATADPVQVMLDEIEYIETEQQLANLVNRSDMDQNTLTKIIQYDIVRPELFDQFYRVALSNNWSSMIRMIGKDPRVGESVIVDIINKLPVDKPGTLRYLNEYIRNPSANAAAISAAIKVFEAAPRTTVDADYITNTILEDGYFNLEGYTAYTPDAGDISTIQSFLEKHFDELTDSQNKTDLALKFRWSRYASPALLEKAYTQFELTGNHEVHDWANHPNMPLSILNKIAEISLNRGGAITALIDHPNADSNLRNKFYAKLDTISTDNNTWRNYFAPGIAAATTNPMHVYERLVDAELNDQGGGGHLVLLKNPALPLALSEKLVTKYGCPHDGVNDSYARAHFQKLPEKSCYSAALHSRITPEAVKQQIYREYKMHKHSDMIKTAKLPPEQMQYLYCMHKGAVIEKMSYNPYTPESILVDMFENSHKEQIIDGLAQNPSTPPWMIDKILLNDYVTRTRNRNIKSKLSCNPSISGNIRKYFKYQYPTKNCYNRRMDHSILQYVKSKEHTEKAMDCSEHNRKVLLKAKPEVITEDYGIIVFKPDVNSNFYKEMHGQDKLFGEYEIVKTTNQIPAKLGTDFGTFFSINDYDFKELFGDEVELELKILFPRGGLTNPETGVTESYDSEISSFKASETYLNSFKFDNPWEIKPGKWVFQVKYKNSVLTEKTFEIE